MHALFILAPLSAEYWRWWVVHLWVEGFFEVFATVLIAFLFTRLKLLSVRTATRSVLFLDSHLFVGRNYRNVPSPLLRRYTRNRAGLGSSVQRSGTGSPGAD